VFFGGHSFLQVHAKSLVLCWIVVVVVVVVVVAVVVEVGVPCVEGAVPCPYGSGLPSHHVVGSVCPCMLGCRQGVRVISVRVLGCDGFGLTSWVVSGMAWAQSAAAASGRRSIVHMSLGTTMLSVAINDCVAALTAAGVVVVAAAGNTAVDACTVSPASGRSGCGGCHGWGVCVG
jgi:hypothetical protein